MSETIFFSTDKIFFKELCWNFGTYVFYYTQKNGKKLHYTQNFYVYNKIQ